MLKRGLALLLLAATAAAEPEEPSATVTLGQGGRLVPGWQPATFSLTNPTSASVRVRLSVEPLDSDDRPWQKVEAEVDLPPGGRQRRSLLFRCESWSASIRLSAAAAGRELLGRDQRRMDANVRNAWQAVPVVLALTAPSSSWVQEIRSVPTRNAQANPDRFDLVEGSPETLPLRPEGFGKVAAVLVSGFPFEEVPDAALDALAAWTASGGHLVLTATPQGIPDRLTSRIPPLKAYAHSTTSDFGALEKAHGAPLGPHGPAPFLAGPPGFPWGRGKIDVIPVDPGLKPFRGWAGMAKVWERTLQPAAPSLPEPWAARDDRFSGDAYSFEDALRPDLCRELKKGLTRALPAGLISGVVAFYLLVMGPLQFLLLRRFWSPTRAVVTIPALAVLFTLGVMGLGYATRGVGTRVNQATLRLALPGGGELVRTYAAVFASFPGTVGAALAPGAAGEVLFPDRQAAQEGFHVLTEAGISEVPVRMWSTRFLGASRWQAGSSALEAKEGRIRNAGKARFDRVLVVDDRERAADLGALEPGGSCPSEPAAWGRLETGEGFEAAFLRGTAGQLGPGRWAIGVARTPAGALLTPGGTPEGMLSLALLRLP